MQMTHTDDCGDYLCDDDGSPENLNEMAFDEYELNGLQERFPAGRDRAGNADIAWMLALICVAYVACTIAEAPGRLLRWAGGTSAPFAALAVIIIGGIAVASAVAMIF